MKLADLKAEFVTYHVTPGVLMQIANDASDSSKGSHDEVRDQVSFRKVDTLAEAQGVMFLCPKCYAANGGSVGTHRVICWSRSRGVPDSAQPGPGRWTLEGTSLDDLTLNGDPLGGARSVLLTGGGCAWHGFVTNGDAA